MPAPSAPPQTLSTPVMQKSLSETPTPAPSFEMKAAPTPSAVTMPPKSKIYSPTGSSSPKPTRIPLYMNRSGVIKSPSYECLCPLTISVPSDGNDYYVYLRYLRDSNKSKQSRKRVYNSPYEPEDDMSIYIKSGDSFSVDVPIGVYQFFFTCGKNWYGTTECFGSGSSYYKSNDRVEFYNDGEYLCGHTIELWLQTSGNFDRTSIPESEFPK